MQLELWNSVTDLQQAEDKLNRARRRPPLRAFSSFSSWIPWTPERERLGIELILALGERTTRILLNEPPIVDDDPA